MTVVIDNQGREGSFTKHVLPHFPWGIPLSLPRSSDGPYLAVPRNPTEVPKILVSQAVTVHTFMLL